MSDFSTIVGDVIAETGRPDKTSLIKSRVNAAIMRLSQFYQFKFDLQYVEYAIPTADQSNLIHLIPYASLPRYRKADAVHGGSDYLPLEPVDSKNATCRGQARKGTYYESALGIHASLYYPSAIIKVSYWQNPAPLVSATDTCWHLQHAYNLILDLSVAYVMRSVGDTAEFDRLIPLAQLQMEEFKNDVGGI